jgi:hypothetical protein
MRKFYKGISARLQLAEELYGWGWRWAVLVIWGLPYGGFSFYDLLRGEWFPSWPTLGEMLPNWLPPLWFGIGIVAFFIITFEGAYRIVQKERGKGQNISKSIDFLAELINEANKLRIINTNESAPELSSILEEAINWTRKAITEITNNLGATEGKKIRAELPLNGEISNEDFMVQFSHEINESKLSLIRARHYKVYYWIRDYISTSPLNSDK